jgi:hypothetical protein
VDVGCPERGRETMPQLVRRPVVGVDDHPTEAATGHPATERRRRGATIRPRATHDVDGDAKGLQAEAQSCDGDAETADHGAGGIDVPVGD